MAHEKYLMYTKCTKYETCAILLSVNHCLLLLSLFLCFLFCYAVPSVLSSFSIILLRKGELAALIVFCVSSSQCHGWSAVCDCGIS